MTDTKRFPAICSVLVEQLDKGRDKWFSLVKELIADELAPLGEKIINEDFLEERNIGMCEHDTPNAFPFNSVAGDTVEAALIGWQMQVFLGFSRKKGYLNFDDEAVANIFFENLVRTIQDKPHWVLSLATFFTEYKMDQATEELGQAVSLTLAHYLMNDATSSKAVVAVKEVVEKNLRLLGFFTWLGTAVAFVDVATATQLMAQMKPDA